MLAVSIRCIIIRCMRTTLQIDDDVLRAARELAAREKKTAGRMISELARRGLQHRARRRGGKIVNGFEILPAENRVVTPRLVQQILEQSSEA